MAFALSPPGDYGYVLVVATSTFFLNTVHSTLTGRARKSAGIAYPASYASNEQAAKDPKAYKFNCAQRAHANFTENHTSFLGALLISGLRYPAAAAAIGAVWSVSRLLYAFGYTSEAGPQGRVVGAIGGSLCDLTLKFTALYTSLALALNW